MREPLEREALHEALVTPGGPWTGVTLLPAVGSTNDEAARLGQAGHIVLTEHQQHGKGRLGRAWETPAHTSLTMSAVLPTPAQEPGWMPLLAGLAVLRGLQEVSGLQAGLKWPNDVQLPTDDERKVCGVLCEVHPAGVVVGIGINVLQVRDELPVDTATSVHLAGGQADRTELAVAVLRHLATLHADHTAGGGPRERAHTAYRRACLTIGREVDVHEPSGAVRRVVARAVDDEGRLVVAEGSREYAVAAGDVVHVRNAAG